MNKKNLLLIGLEMGQTELLSDLLEKEGYSATPVNNFEDARFLLSKDKFTICLMDIDSSETSAEDFLQLLHIFKGKLHSSESPVFIVFIDKKDFRKIASSIEAGVERFILKPFETDYFLKRLKVLFKEIGLKKRSERLLDLNCINYLINLTNELSREGFFLLFPVIFNKLIMDKVKPVLGEQVVEIMFNRVCELTGDNYKFIKQARLQNGEILVDGVDEVSADISIEMLKMGFHNFIYDFLHLLQTLTSHILVEKWTE